MLSHALGCRLRFRESLFAAFCLLVSVMNVCRKLATIQSLETNILFSTEAEGVQRARSASEAFLFRRLETLEETTGRFRLNAELSIPFDGWGKMEVDLLDEETRLVIELDGGQHFANEDAYRRDRRKDALLQEHGYFVLRFLVQDIGAQLDHVLDTILRAYASTKWQGTSVSASDHERQELSLAAGLPTMLLRVDSS
jgi:very-short-patch-repair endonuclease